MCSCNFVIISWCKKVLPFHLKELKSSSTGMGWFLLSLVEMGPVVLKKIFLCPLFRNYLRMEKEEALYLNNVESPSQKDNLCKVSLNCSVVLKKEIFFKFVIDFFFFQNRYFFLFERDDALHLIKLESLSHSAILCKFWLKFAHWFWRRWFFKFVNGFYHFLIISTWKKNGVLYLIKLNTLHQGMICAQFS